MRAKIAALVQDCLGSGAIDSEEEEIEALVEVLAK
jgi:hypothetical protein